METGPQGWAAFLPSGVGNNPSFLKLPSRWSPQNHWVGERGLFKGSRWHPPSGQRSHLLISNSFWQNSSVSAKTLAVKVPKMFPAAAAGYLLGSALVLIRDVFYRKAIIAQKLEPCLTFLDGKFLGRLFFNGQKGQITRILVQLFQKLGYFKVCFSFCRFLFCSPGCAAPWLPKGTLGAEAERRNLAAQQGQLATC